MLTLLLGPDHKVYEKETLQRLLRKTETGEGNQYLIVPEQFSFEAERRLCEMGGDCVSRFAEVLSLKRLAGRVESIYGGTTGVWLDHGGRLLAAAQAVELVSSRLKLYAGVCRKTEFLETFVAAVDEFSGYGVTAQTLCDLAGQHSGQFAQKLSELGLLYESYLAVCTRAKDPARRLENLLKVLKTEDYAEDKDFYICGFTDFTALEREILQELILSARSVTMALPEETVGENPVFSTAKDTLRTFEKFCGRQNIPFAVECFGYDESVPSDLLLLQKHLPATAAPSLSDHSEHIAFSRHDTVEEECRNTVQRVMEQVEGGAKFRDIAIACADLTSYAPVLRPMLERCGIPAFFSGKHPITENAGTKMVLYGLRAASEGLEQTAVLDYLKSGAASLELDCCDRLENYAKFWNISGKRWISPWTQHPRGVGEEWLDADREALQRLNDWKEEALKPLFSLRQELQKAENVGAMALAVAKFADAIELPQKLQRKADALYRLGEYDKAQQMSQIYDIFMDALEQMYLVMENAARTAEEFCRLVEKLMEQYSVSAIPAAVDQLFVGEISSLRGRSVRHLMVVGAGEGVFPAVSHGVGIFTEEERKTLLSRGLSLAPLQVDVVERDLGNLYAAVRSATVSASFNCTGEPSYLLSKLADFFGGLKRAEPLSILLDEGELAAHLVRVGDPAGEYQSIEKYMHLLRDRSCHAFGEIQKENVRKLYGKDLFLSASRIDKFASCRFAYFMRYGLKAEPEKRASFDASAFGTFVHAVMEQTARIVMDKGGFRSVSEAELLKIAEAVMDEYESTVLRDLAEDNARFQYLFRRNRRETLAVVRDLGEELRNSDFEPAAFELEFSAGKDMDAVRIRGKEATGHVEGFVDRVDLYRHSDVTYVRVVDYKTGRKDFDYADIEVGEGLQMLIYLFAICRNGQALFGQKLQPAGVLYHSARQDVVSFTERPDVKELEKAKAKAGTRKGIILNEDLVISAMEHFEKAPKYLPFKINKSGERSGDLAARAEMRNLEKHVFEKLETMTDEILSGDVTPDPVMRGSGNSACTYCDYQEVCQKDFAKHRERRLCAVKNREFFTKLEKKGETEHG